ncbi:MAG TPA: efflux RND transporter periplasmic adaptor subunit [Candidatus Aquilonibacter sp.]|nr:efflux RND transporter periplasmic adaptor subunit [Candidatus Aquilonibacter sp.]
MEPPPVLTKPRPKRRKKFIIIAVIAVVVIALALVAVFKNQTPPISVQTIKVSRHSITNLVVANGQIQPVVQVTISPEVSGEIIELPVKEGQFVNKGDLLVKINPDVYIAATNQADASYKSALAAKVSAAASLEKAQADYDRNLELFKSKLLSESDFIGFKATRDVAQAQLDSADDQVNVAKAAVDSAEEELDRTTIVSPLTGTITSLNSEVGERVLGTVQNAGTEIMTISDLNEIEARVDVGEMDVVGIKAGQKAQLEVDAFKDRKFTGVVTAVADSAVGSDSQNESGMSSSGQSQQATQFEVRIRVSEKEPAFRPGMSVTAEIETEYRTNVLTVPLASVTTRPMKPEMKTDPAQTRGTNSTASVAGTNAGKTVEKSAAAKSNEGAKPTDVVFIVAGDHVKAVPVKIGICDDNYWEITDGLTNGEEIVSGGYRAIGRDLEDGSKIRIGLTGADSEVK